MSGMQGLPANIGRAASNFVSGDYKAVPASPKESSAKAQAFSMGYFPNPVRSSEGFERANNKCLNALQLGGLLTVGLPVLAGFAAGAAMINGYHAAKHAVHEKQTETLEKRKTTLEEQMKKNNEEIEGLNARVPGLTEAAAKEQKASEYRKASGESATDEGSLITNLTNFKTQLNGVHKDIEIIKGVNADLKKEIDSINKKLTAKEQSSGYSIVYADTSSTAVPQSVQSEAPPLARDAATVRTEFTRLGYELRYVENKLRNDPQNPDLIADHKAVRAEYDKVRAERNQHLFGS